MIEKLLEKITIPSAIVERIYNDCRCLNGDIDFHKWEFHIFSLFQPYVKRKYPKYIYIRPTQISEIDKKSNDSNYVSFRCGDWMMRGKIEWYTSDGQSGEIEAGGDNLEVDIIVLQKTDRKISLDEKAVREIENILERGNSVEVRKRKDSVVILEVKAKQQYTVAVNG